LSRACLDVALIRRYAAALVSLRLTHRATFIVTVPLLTSAQDLRWLNEHLPDCVMSEDVPQQLLSARDPREQGISACVETISALKEIPGVSGVNLIYRGDVADILDVLKCLP